MKKFLFALGLLLSFYSIFSQTPNFNYEITLGLSLTKDTVIEPFNGLSATGLGISGNITLNSDSSLVRIIVKNKDDAEFLVYESYPMIADTLIFNFSNKCDESCFFDGFVPNNMIIQLKDASITIHTVSWSDIQYSNPLVLQRQAKRLEDSVKVATLLNYIIKNHFIWVPSRTPLSSLFYSMKKKMWGDKYQTNAFEYYYKGFYSSRPLGNMYRSYGYVDNFDWRNRHNANMPNPYYYNGDNGWITSIKCQGGCYYNSDYVCGNEFDPNSFEAICNLPYIYRGTGSCWIFSAVGAVEAIENLYYNRFINDDLSELHIQCLRNNFGDGDPKDALEEFKSNIQNGGDIKGVIDEDHLHYIASSDNSDCHHELTEVNQWVKIDDYDSYDFNELSLNEAKDNLISYGPLATAYYWGPTNYYGHSMTLVGWDIIDEDDFDEIQPYFGQGVDLKPFLGFTYWIFKQSMGSHFGDYGGYVFMIFWDDEVPEVDVVHTPLTTKNFTDNDIQCTDKDGDGYYFWGIRKSKPSQCPLCPDEEDGDDSNPSLGPMDSKGFCTIINSYTSSFEKTWDNWKQVQYDNPDPNNLYNYYDWTRHKGIAPIPNPDHGPQSSEDGQYYIYAFDPAPNGRYKNYGIESPPINLSRFCKAQIEFYYNIKNNGDGSGVMLEYSTNGGATWAPGPPLWYSETETDEQWVKVTVRFPSNANKLRFWAINYGDPNHIIALDNITIGPVIPSSISITRDPYPITTWYQNAVKYDDINIEAGATLIIQNCTVSMYDKTKINIKNGGTLILDNTTITNYCTNGWWQGINVWGDNTKSQYPDPVTGNMYQGKLIIRNNSVIENSDYAVRLWNPGNYSSENYSTGGGIVQASDSYFKNNRHAVEFISYHNFNTSSNHYAGNLSFFNKCTFSTDDDFPSSLSFLGFITMWDVEGVNIRGCSFINTSTLTDSPARGYGIYTEDASYNVRSYCNSQMNPCPDEDLVRTSFVGLNTGIKASNDLLYSKSLSVHQAIFTNNSYGVYLKSVNDAIVVCSHFDIGPNTICPYYTGVGTFLNGCTNYTIQGNTFTPTQGASGANFIGTLVTNLSPLPPPYTEIYNNTYTGLTVGNQAEQNNYSPYGDGLHYLFNQNYNNNYDFYVTGKGIAKNQWLQLSDNDFFAAGNRFSQDNNNSASDFNNQGDHPITYNYHYKPGVNHEEPIYVYRVDKSTLSHHDSTIVCNTGGVQSFNLTSGQIDSCSANFAFNNTKYDSILAIYNSLIDGGNTSSMLNSISSATQQNKAELIRILSQTSPYLSEDALKGAVDRYDIITDTVLSGILAANPEELNNQEFIQYLENRKPEIPQGIINYLISISDDTTNKTTLLREISSYNIPRSKAAFAIIRSLVHDTILDTIMLRSWLRNLHELSADYRIVDSWLQEKNSTAAFALLDSLPEKYKLNYTEQSEYNNFVILKNIQANLINEGKSIFQLDSAQIVTLDSIALNGQGIAVTQAKNILDFALGINFIDCSDIVRPPNDKPQMLIIPKPLIANETLINAFPNPTDNSITFAYRIPVTGDGASFITISNLNGQIIEKILLHDLHSQVIWNTKRVPSGIYFYNLRCGKSLKTGKISVIH